MKPIARRYLPLLPPLIVIVGFGAMAFDHWVLDGGYSVDSNDPLNYAVMFNLDAVVQTHKLPDISDYDLQCELRRFADAKLWAKGLSDRKLRAAYLNWLDFYERQLRADKGRALREMQQESTSTGSSAVDRGRAMAASLPQPPESKVQCEPGSAR